MTFLIFLELTASADFGYTCCQAASRPQNPRTQELPNFTNSLFGPVTRRSRENELGVGF